MNIRVAIAMEVAEQMGAHVLAQPCPTCTTPLIEKTEQNLPFCWICVTDRASAHNGRTALIKEKMKEQGIVLEIRESLPGFIL